MVTDLVNTAYEITFFLASEGLKTEDAFPDERAIFMPALKGRARSHCDTN